MSKHAGIEWGVWSGQAWDEDVASVYGHTGTL